MSNTPNETSKRRYSCVQVRYVRAKSVHPDLAYRLHCKVALRWVMFVLITGCIVTSTDRAIAQFKANYDEENVPAFELPPILDEATESASNFNEAWSKRRAELLDVFAKEMYGSQPSSKYKVRFEKFESGTSLGGKALRQQYDVVVSTGSGEHTIQLLVFTPSKATKPVPTFLGLSFFGNHTTATDPEIAITTSWCRQSDDKGVIDHKATEAGRGKSSSRWPIELIVDAGYGVATAYCGDIDPDFDDGFDNGVHRIFPEHKPTDDHPDRWGTISAWAWGLSRCLDCLTEAVPEVDGSKVVVIGHSRLGKTSLWAAATDKRFAGAISNDSGCGGAALSRRAFGETVGRINDSFPHWFCGNFKKYNENEGELPIDQHQLVALVAPRPVYVASASQDQWADPKGEFLSLKNAERLYAKFGVSPLRLQALPEPNTAEVGVLSYHLREGKHDINEWDWKRYAQFMSQLESE